MARRRNPYPALVVRGAGAGAVAGRVLAVRRRQGPDAASRRHRRDRRRRWSTPAALTTPLLSVRRTPGDAAPRRQPRRRSPPQLEALPAADRRHVVRRACRSTASWWRRRTPDVPLRPASNVKLITAAVALEVLGRRLHATPPRCAATVADGRGGRRPVPRRRWRPAAEQRVVEGPEHEVPAVQRHVHRGAGGSPSAPPASRASTGRSSATPAATTTSGTRPAGRATCASPRAAPSRRCSVNDSREVDRHVVERSRSVGAATVLTEALRDRRRHRRRARRRRARPRPTHRWSRRSQSQPLPAVLQEMLTTSDNNTAEMVLKEIGADGRRRGHPRGRPRRGDRRRCRQWGVPTGRRRAGRRLGAVRRQPADVRGAAGRAAAPVASTTRSGRAWPSPARPGARSPTRSSAPTWRASLRGKTGTLYNYDDGTGGKPAAKSLSGFVPGRRWGSHRVLDAAQRPAGRREGGLPADLGRRSARCCSTYPSGPHRGRRWAPR